MAARPEKRARTDSESVAVPVKVEPNAHPIENYTQSDIWFDDGNVILLAESTIFRVHRSILSSQSPVFKTMLADPTQASHNLHDCPVFPLIHTAQDVTCFLKALFDRRYDTSERPIRTELNLNYSQLLS